MAVGLVDLMDSPMATTMAVGLTKLKALRRDCPTRKEKVWPRVTQTADGSVDLMDCPRATPMADRLEKPKAFRRDWLSGKQTD
jgi:hypothetical protein